MPECIHGLEIPLCDACYPKAVPEKPALSRAPSRGPKAAPVRSSRKTIDVGAQRVYHVTHLSNLESIIEAGELLPTARPAVDLSTPLARELRVTAETGREHGVGEYVAFSLAPTAVWWTDLLEGATDTTRWSDAARTSAPSDFVFLVTTVGALGEDAVLSDGDAAGTMTRFSTRESMARMLERLHDDDAAREAEVLALGAVPLTALQIVGVANEPVRDRVRKLLPTKVAVYPPWFQPTP